jgi:hypothetical protein
MDEVDLALVLIEISSFRKIRVYVDTKDPVPDCIL